ncbi:HesA/MoeB/ThiF family protein [Desulfothermus okinawensis JCM 13304]
MDLSHLIRNFSAITKKDQERLLYSRVLVVGCGGLGGYVLEILARIGVGHLIFADGDRFEETNLNRQLLCSVNTLGKNKAEVAKKRILEIAPHCRPFAISRNLIKEEVVELGRGTDIVIDAVGGTLFKKEIVAECLKNSIPIITGAVAGFEGFVSTVLSGFKTPVDFFMSKDRDSAEHLLGCTAPIVSIIGTLQAYEAISYICWEKSNFAGKVFYISLKDFSFSTFEL